MKGEKNQKEEQEKVNAILDREKDEGKQQTNLEERQKQKSEDTQNQEIEQTQKRASVASANVDSIGNNLQATDAAPSSQSVDLGSPNTLQGFTPGKRSGPRTRLKPM